jgi:NitT/TauT family transport system ATP-binding protein
MYVLAALLKAVSLLDAFAFGGGPSWTVVAVAARLLNAAFGAAPPRFADRVVPSPRSGGRGTMRPVTAAHIEVRAVAKRWLTRDQAVPALEAVSLDVAPHEFLTVLGPSGCGKSTLLAILGGLTTPDAGEVRIAGRPVTGPDPRQVAMVFQDPGLFPWRTALENVEFGLELQGVPAAARRERARALLEPVGLRGFEGRYPRELSGGMKQRVAIARALALDAPILLMDEPFGALDEQTRLLMGEWLLGIWARTRKTVVFVTHSLQESILLSQRVVVMTARPGRVKASFAVALPTPRDLDAPPAAALRHALWDAIRDESLRALDGGV